MTFLPGVKMGVITRNIACVITRNVTRNYRNVTCPSNPSRYAVKREPFSTQIVLVNDTNTSHHPIVAVTRSAVSGW